MYRLPKRILRAGRVIACVSSPGSRNCPTAAVGRGAQSQQQAIDLTQALETRSNCSAPALSSTAVSRSETMRGRRDGIAVLVGILVLSACSSPETVVGGFGDGAQKLRVVNRQVTEIEDRNGVRLLPRSGNGVAWVEGTDFRSGTIEVDIRGREDMQQNYVGIAFHRTNDNTYEAVYLRPFNFRVADPLRRQHAVQYISLPAFDWPRLREDFPEEFENPVHPSIVPTDWVKLRVVVNGSKVQIYVGPVSEVTLEVRKLGQLDGGEVGLWLGNVSGGDFANLVVTPTK